MNQHLQGHHTGTIALPGRPAYMLRPRDVLLYVGIPVYLLSSLLLFFTWVNPSLQGKNDDHIAADSATYMRFADSLKAGENNPYVLASLAVFPNTFWGPVLLGLAMPNTFAIVLANYAILLASVWLIWRSTQLDLLLFLCFLFANVTTSISLLTLNKEIFDLLATALFLYYLAHGKRLSLLAALVLAAVCRYETCVVMLVYLGLLSRWNSLRQSRVTSLILVVLGLSFVLAGPLANNLAYRMQESSATARSGGLLLFLDNLEVHYLFFIAVIPKVLDNLFSEMINFSNWSRYSLTDPANSYFLLGNNLATFGLVAYLLVVRRFTLRSNLVYYACLSAIFMSTALIIQPRYFFGAYIVLCVEAARHRHTVPSPVSAELYAAG